MKKKIITLKPKSISNRSRTAVAINEDTIIISPTVAELARYLGCRGTQVYASITNNYKLRGYRVTLFDTIEEAYIAIGEGE